MAEQLAEQRLFYNYELKSMDGRTIEVLPKPYFLTPYDSPVNQSRFSLLKYAQFGYHFTGVLFEDGNVGFGDYGETFFLEAEPARKPISYFHADEQLSPDRPIPALVFVYGHTKEGLIQLTQFLKNSCPSTRTRLVLRIVDQPEDLFATLRVKNLWSGYIKKFTSEAILAIPNPRG